LLGQLVFLGGLMLAAPQLVPVWPVPGAVTADLHIRGQERSGRLWEARAQLQLVFRPDPEGSMVKVTERSGWRGAHLVAIRDISVVHPYLDQLLLDQRGMVVKVTLLGPSALPAFRQFEGDTSSDFEHEIGRIWNTIAMLSKFPRRIGPVPRTGPAGPGLSIDTETRNVAAPCPGNTDETCHGAQISGHMTGELRTRLPVDVMLLDTLLRDGRGRPVSFESTRHDRRSGKRTALLLIFRHDSPP
jgi:hypothetical protein